MEEKKQPEEMSLSEIGVGLFHWLKPFVDTEGLKKALRHEGLELAQKLAEHAQDESTASDGKTLSTSVHKGSQGLPEPCSVSLLKIRRWNEARVLAKVRKKVMRYGLPAPEFTYTENGLDITVTSHNKQKSFSFTERAANEQWMLDHIDHNVRSLRPNNRLKLNDRERRAIINKLHYISDEIHRQRFIVLAINFADKDTFASIRWGNNKYHEVYLHSTQRNLDHIIDSLLEQKNPLTSNNIRRY